MFINKNFKILITKEPLTKTPSKTLVSMFLKKTQKVAKGGLVAAALLSTCGCSTIGQKISQGADAIKTDVQTAHDGNFRIGSVRKALVSGNIQEAEEHRDTLFSPHWRCVANIEIAAAQYPTSKKEAKKRVQATTEKIWNIKDPNQRACALLSLLEFEIGTEKDIAKAKNTIEQIENTIAFILGNDAKQRMRYVEFEGIQEKYNHLLSR